MQIKDLESVISVYKYNSFSEAAFRMNFSVSAISKQIARVEKELNVVIFERRNKGSGRFVTPEGEVIIPVIQDILSSYTNLEYLIQNFSETDSRHISLGCVPIIGTMGEDDILTAYQSDNPDVRVDLSFDDNMTLIHGLMSGSLDGIFLMMMGAVPSTFHMFEAIADEELITVQTMRNKNLFLGISGDHPFASKDSIDLSDIVNETFIFSTLQGEGSYDNRINELQKLMGNDCPEIKSHFMDFRNKDVVLRLVESGKAVLPQLMLPRTYGRNIQFVKVNGWPDETTGLFLCRKNNNSKTLRHFLKYVRDFSRQLGYTK